MGGGSNNLICTLLLIRVQIGEPTNTRNGHIHGVHFRFQHRSHQRSLLPPVCTSFPAIRISFTSSRKYCLEKPLSLLCTLAWNALPNAAICVDVILSTGKVFCYAATHTPHSRPISVFSELSSFAARRIIAFSQFVVFISPCVTETGAKAVTLIEHINAER